MNTSYIYLFDFWKNGGDQASNKGLAEKERERRESWVFKKGSINRDKDPFHLK